MKVTDVELIPLALPFERPYVTARGTLDAREMFLIRVQTDEGIEGLGEAVPLSLRGGADMRSVYRALLKASRRLKRSDLSDFSGPEPLMAAVDVFIHTAAGRRLPAPVKAAVEMAIFDLAGKASGRPLWSLLKAERAQPVRCNATLIAAAPAEVAADAERWAALGFDTFKLKLGSTDDVARVRAVREALGVEATIRVDANGIWSVEEALGVIKLIEPLGIELVASVKDARRAREASACDLATVKLAKVGGIGEANGIAGHLPIYLSSALDGPVGIAAAGHAAQALPAEGPAAGLAHGLATQLLFADTTASAACEIADGTLLLSSRPGLGVELDEKAVERLRT